MSRWVWVVRRITQQIWFRAVLISVGAVVLALAAAGLAPYLPYEFNADLGQDAVGRILQIMASSMLAVTTFSLTAMVQAYSSATQLATPRATQLMIRDPTSQNALSTFLGAFVFSIVGIIALSTGTYGGEGRIILFVGTVVVIAVVVMTLLRWIAHLTAFGRMADVIDRVEHAADEAMAGFTRDPHLGGRPAAPVPDGARPIHSDRAGYVTYVDVAALGRAAEKHGLVIHVAALPGTMVHPERPLAHVQGLADPAIADDLTDAFTIERHRGYEQDPRLGLIALSEIASRALSPAVNDPGTAIEVLNALTRVLLRLPADRLDPATLAERPAVYVPRPSPEAMLTDSFRPIMRDGATMVEVLIRLSKALAALYDGLPHARAAIRALADELPDRGRRGLVDAADCAALDGAHARIWRDRPGVNVELGEERR